MPTDAPTDACPQCGGRMMPVLDRTAAPSGSGPLLADSPVHLSCPTCTAPTGSEVT